MISGEIYHNPLEQSNIQRDKRQRKEINSDKVRELAESIRTKDLIHTILLEKVDENCYTLISGENRIEAFRFLNETDAECLNPKYRGWNFIPARCALDVTAIEIEALELEENIKRSDLTWKEEVDAINRYHRLREVQDEEHSARKTAAELGLSSGSISRYIAVATELEKENPRVLAASGVSAAYNIISRATERAVEAEMELLDDTFEDDFNLPDPDAPETSLKKEVEPESIFCEDFIKWAATYEGKKFNFVHCDFPYGVNHQKSDQGNTAQWGAYDDTPEVYFALLDAFCSFQDNFMNKSAHVIFWFSMNFYEETIAYFNKYSDLTVQPFPLIWHKSDNKGILPDPTRGPRRVYETALLLSRGDRKIVQAVSNLYGAPASKELHVSEKSEAMLRHFFRMLVDEYTEILDPTCGSGTALRAAEALGAKRVMGLELSPENTASANGALQTARRIRKMSEETANEISYN